MDRFDEEEKKIIESLGFDINKKEFSDKEWEHLEFKVTELYTMYGFDDDAFQTSLGDIYETILNKLH